MNQRQVQTPVVSFSAFSNERIIAEIYTLAEFQNTYESVEKGEGSEVFFTQIFPLDFRQTIVIFNSDRFLKR
jgi:hypothetical protein